jgi:hypothetical protein
MWFDRSLEWLGDTPVAIAIAESTVMFPWIESVHVLAIVLVVGTISIVDLRLIGWAWLDRPVVRLMGDVLPYTWGAFAVAVMTGALMFCSNATTYGHNFFFQGKMVLVALAGFNMSIFHVFFARDIERWGAQPHPPVIAKVAGIVSLGLWISVVAFGRWVGFTLQVVHNGQ